MWVATPTTASSTTQMSSLGRCSASWRWYGASMTSCSIQRPGQGRYRAQKQAQAQSEGVDSKHGTWPTATWPAAEVAAASAPLYLPAVHVPAASARCLCLLGPLACARCLCLLPSLLCALAPHLMVLIALLPWLGPPPAGAAVGHDRHPEPLSVEAGPAHQGQPGDRVFKPRAQPGHAQRIGHHPAGNAGDLHGGGERGVGRQAYVWAQ